MRKIISFLMLFLAASPAFAAPPLPEPETLSLILIGAASLLTLSRRKK